MAYGTEEYREKFKDYPDGRLQDHMAVCDYCEGNEEYESCPTCDDHREVRWGSWYRGDLYECAHCDDDEEKPVGCMFDGSNPGELDWICFACYVAVHRKACGCSLFDWANGIEVERSTK